MITDSQREAVARALADQRALDRGDLPYSDISWGCVRGEEMHRLHLALPTIERVFADAISSALAADRERIAVAIEREASRSMGGNSAPTGAQRTRAMALNYAASLARSAPEVTTEAGA